MNIRRVLSWVVTFIVPVAVVLTSVRLLMNPWFLEYEYHRPGFPPDSYGFTTQDRLHWSGIALDYLLNDAGIDFLGDLRFQDGTPVYNARELSHMVDVKNAIQITLIVWYASLLILAGLWVWAWRARWLDDFRAGVRRGGWLTAGLLLFILIFVFVGFGVFFVFFHNIFFQPGTWTFRFSDTLIRLFPERFWQDIFIIVGSLSLAAGLALAFGLHHSSTPGPD